MESMMFDYRSLSEELDIPVEVVRLFEREAYDEFPNDSMLVEIHVLRAVKAYVKANSKIVVCEA
ncbi:MAG: hypothetical protein FWC64_07460 [Treponema sp.]|nr:hypothetical protein [Treponema sp.]